MTLTDNLIFIYEYYENVHINFVDPITFIIETETCLILYVMTVFDMLNSIKSPFIDVRCHL